MRKSLHCTGTEFDSPPRGADVSILVGETHEQPRIAAIISAARKSTPHSPLRDVSDTRNITESTEVIGSEAESWMRSDDLPPQE